MQETEKLDGTVSYCSLAVRCSLFALCSLLVIVFALSACHPLSEQCSRHDAQRTGAGQVGRAMSAAAPTNISKKKGPLKRFETSRLYCVDLSSL